MTLPLRLIVTAIAIVVSCTLVTSQATISVFGSIDCEGLAEGSLVDVDACRPPVGGWEESYKSQYISLIPELNEWAITFWDNPTCTGPVAGIIYGTGTVCTNAGAAASFTLQTPLTAPYIGIVYTDATDCSGSVNDEFGITPGCYDSFRPEGYSVLWEINSQNWTSNEYPQLQCQGTPVTSTGIVGGCTEASGLVVMATPNAEYKQIVAKEHSIVTPSANDESTLSFWSKPRCSGPGSATPVTLFNCTAALAPWDATFETMLIWAEPNLNQWSMNFWNNPTCVGPPSNILYGTGSQCSEDINIQDFAFSLVTPITAEYILTQYQETNCTGGIFNQHGITNGCFQWLLPYSGSVGWSVNAQSWTGSTYSNENCFGGGSPDMGNVGVCDQTTGTIIAPNPNYKKQRKEKIILKED